MTIKVASLNPIQTRSYRKNDRQIHWNYVRIYLDKGQAKASMFDVISGGLILVISVRGLITGDGSR
ncbi:hypothetical protein MH1LPH_21180 [Lactiplantibacillus brownii]